MSLRASVNPHETKREQVENRRSVADILDEEFDILEKGDNRANSYKTAGLSFSIFSTLYSLHHYNCSPNSTRKARNFRKVVILVNFVGVFPTLIPTPPKSKVMPILT